MVVPGNKNASLKYRPDIDGLRALAVMGVVIYHAGLPLFDGGFVGVDVFFVISGYLIGKMILEEIDAGDFSLTRFYERRVRRIVPALAAMLLFVAVAALLLYPQDMKDTAASMVAAVFSVANIYFQYTTDYFGDEVDTKPLLHTWSLGVEEQFYIFFPLCVIAMRAWPARRRNAALIVIFAISLLASGVMCFRDPVTAFYNPLTRAWELLAGVILGAGLLKPLRNRVAAELSGLVGLALAVAPMFLYGKATPFPGFGAIPPVLGAVLIIHAGTGRATYVSRLLSVRPAVFIGQISYSLYLWHWPLLHMFFVPTANFLAGFALPGLRPVFIRLALLAFAFVLAALSWRYVERPFRDWRRISQRNIFRTGAVAATAILAIAVTTLAADGWPNRFSPEALRLAGYVHYSRASYREGTCFLVSGYTYRDFRHDVCLRHSREKPNYLLVGDSHAAHLWYGLSQVVDANVMQANASGCKPVIDQPLVAEERCKVLMQEMYQRYLPANKVDLLILSARWQPGDFNSLLRTIAWLRQRHQSFVILGPVVQYQYALPYILASSIGKGDALSKRLELKDFEKTDLLMTALMHQQNAPYGSVYHTLCHGGRCVTMAADGVPVQFDYSHLTKEGSLLVAQSLKRSGVFQQALLERSTAAAGN